MLTRLLLCYSANRRTFLLLSLASCAILLFCRPPPIRNNSDSGGEFSLDALATQPRVGNITLYCQNCKSSNQRWKVSHCLESFQVLALTRDTEGLLERALKSFQTLKGLSKVSGTWKVSKIRSSKKTFQFLQTGGVSRLCCYVFCICMLTNNRPPNANQLSWVINKVEVHPPLLFF